MCQLALVDVGSGRRALVWTMHHFLLPECLVLAVGRFDEPVLLREALACVFEINGAPGHPLLKSLPHWTRLPLGSPLDVDTIAALIGSAHRCFVSSDGLRGEHPDATLASLWRLARDPIEECRRQQQRAFEDWGPVTKALLAGEKETAAGLMKELESRQELQELPDDDAYRRWAQFASEPAYVENVRSYFEGAWGEAIRRYRLGDAPSESPDDASESTNST